MCVLCQRRTPGSCSSGAGHGFREAAAPRALLHSSWTLSERGLRGGPHRQRRSANARHLVMNSCGVTRQHPLSEDGGVALPKSSGDIWHYLYGAAGMGGLPEDYAVTREGGEAVVERLKRAGHDAIAAFREAVAAAIASAEEVLGGKPARRRGRPLKGGGTTGPAASSSGRKAAELAADSGVFIRFSSRPPSSPRGASSGSTRGLSQRSSNPRRLAFTARSSPTPPRCSVIDRLGAQVCRKSSNVAYKSVRPAVMHDRRRKRTISAVGRWTIFARARAARPCRRRRRCARSS